MADSQGNSKLKLNLVKSAKPNLAKTSKRLESAFVNYYGSDELAEFAMNTLIDNLENENELAFIKEENGKVRIKRFIFASDEKNDKRRG